MQFVRTSTRVWCYIDQFGAVPYESKIDGRNTTTIAPGMQPGQYLLATKWSRFTEDRPVMLPVLPMLVVLIRIYCINPTDSIHARPIVKIVGCCVNPVGLFPLLDMITTKITSNKGQL